MSNKKKWDNQRFDKLLLEDWERLDNVNNGYNQVRVKCRNDHISWQTPYFIKGHVKCSQCALITSYYGGKEFERLVGKLLLDLNLCLKRKKHGVLNPDYILNNSRWVDAKLSITTVKSSETIKKYEPHCKTLTIIFMRGPVKTDRMITNKTRLISVYNYIKQLPKKRQKYYVNKINEIDNKIKEHYTGIYKDLD